MEPVVIPNAREQEYLLRVIESAVRVRNLHQLFLLTQGQLQSLLPHRLMLCLQFDRADALVRLECLHASVLGEAVLRQLCDPADGLALRLARHCRGAQRMPCIGGSGRRAADLAIEGFRREFEQLGLANLALHGSGALAGGATLFVLCGWPLRPTARHAYFLDLLLPHLHVALLRLAPEAPRAADGPAQRTPARPLSAREAEILGWVREGKSNYEIGRILGISALTVKNHLQRIYKTLGVSNRTHALSRCIALRLLEAAAR